MQTIGIPLITRLEVSMTEVYVVVQERRIWSDEYNSTLYIEKIVGVFRSEKLAISKSKREKTNKRNRSRHYSSYSVKTISLQ